MKRREFIAGLAGAAALAGRAGAQQGRDAGYRNTGSDIGSRICP